MDPPINEWVIIEVDGEISYDGHPFGKKAGEVSRVGHQEPFPLPDGGPCRLMRLVENAFGNLAGRVRTSRSA